MSEIRFYLDENVDGAIADALRNHRVDVLTVVEAGHQGKSDEEQVRFALAEDRVIVTRDEDYPRLHAQGIHHAGIVFYKQEKRPVKEIIHWLLLIHGVMSAEEMLDSIEYL